MTVFFTYINIPNIRSNNNNNNNIVLKLISVKHVFKFVKFNLILQQ